MGILDSVKAKVSSYQAESEKLHGEIARLKNMGFVPDENAIVKIQTQLDGLEDKYIGELVPLLAEDKKAARRELALAYRIPENVSSFLQSLIARHQAAAQSDNKVFSDRAKAILYAELQEHMDDGTVLAYAYANAISVLYPDEPGIQNVLNKAEQVMMDQAGSSDWASAKTHISENETAEKTYQVEFLRPRYIQEYNRLEEKRNPQDVPKLQVLQAEIKRIDGLKAELQAAN